MSNKSARQGRRGPDDVLSVGSSGIDDSDGLACAISSLSPDDLHALSYSLNATDDRGADDGWSGGCGFLSNLY